MSELLYPKPRRRKQKDLSHRPYRVDYSLAYDGGGSSFTCYYRSYFTARVCAFYHVRIGSWGGKAVLTKQKAE